MDHLDEAQIRRLNEISKLPKEQQQVELQEFLSTLSEEQIEFLKSRQQKQQCLFCSIVELKIPQYRVYEDDHFIGILDINPASRGHVILIPKKHYKFITEVGEDFSIPIKKIVSKIYGVLKCDATIMISNGANASQKTDHTSIHIIPRYENDNLNLELKQSKADEEELKELSQMLIIQRDLPKIEEKIEEINEDYEEERIP